MSAQQSIEDRLNTLETQNRRLRNFNRLIFLVVAVVAIGGWKSGNVDTVRASGFEVVNNSGQTVAMFGTAASGRPVLEFHDSNGKKRVHIGFDVAGNGSISVRDANEIERIGIGSMKNDSSTGLISMLDSEGKVNVQLIQSRDERGLLLTDAQGGTRLSALTSGVGVPAFRLYGSGVVESSWEIIPGQGSQLSFAKHSSPGNSLEIRGAAGQIVHIANPLLQETKNSVWP